MIKLFEKKPVSDHIQIAKFPTAKKKGEACVFGSLIGFSDYDTNELEITYLTAKQRLLRAGIKPVAKDAIFPRSALEAIRNVPGKGRPPKAKPEAKPAKAKKAKK